MSDNDKKSQIPDEMGTLFIMDLLRQKQEKALREKKDQMITQMALEQKKKKEEKKGHQSGIYNSAGGFVGIDALTKDNNPKWTAAKRQKKQLEATDINFSIQETNMHFNYIQRMSDNELFILGLIKEQRQETKDKERQEISEKSLACASDINYRKKFER